MKSTTCWAIHKKGDTVHSCHLLPGLQACMDTHNSTYLGVNTCIESQCISFKGGSTKPLVVAKMGPVAPPEQKGLQSASQAMMLSRGAAVPYHHGRLFCIQAQDLSSLDACPYRLFNGTYHFCSTALDWQDSSRRLWLRSTLFVQ